MCHSGAKKHCKPLIREQADMRKMILALAILYPAAAFAQGTTAPPAHPAPPPTVGGKPLVVVGSKKPATAKKSAKPAEPAKPQSVAQKLQVCQDIDDGTKDRLARYQTTSNTGTQSKPA